MRKVRKVMALLLTLAMVMGMSLTTFAEGTTADITITNAGNGKFAAIQVIKPSETKDTGWDFVNNYAKYFKEAFDTEDTQSIIKGMIYAQNPKATEGQAISDFDAKYASALNAIYATIKDEDCKDLSPISVNAAGVWVIKGGGTGYSYSPMAAYVGFSYESGKPSGILDATDINAKKAPTTITKSNDDEDKVVEIGKEVTYTVTGTVPYVPVTANNRYYKITDQISGAEYNVPEGSAELNVNVKIGSAPQYAYEHTYSVKPADVTDSDTGEKTGETFTLDLTSILGTKENNNANKYANSPITITYSAIVKDLKIGNTVIAGDGTNTGKDKYGSDEDKLISGIVTLTKKDAEDESIKLPGAVFNLIKKENNKTYYAIVEGTNPYTLTGWTEDDSQASKLETNDNSQIVVNGLEKDVNYEFDEIEAPDGYSINDINSNITWGNVDSNLDTPVTGTSSMTDTKLAELPGTGGIGTTIFTIGGCVIMIAAAGLYFASRRKHSEN